MHDLGVADLGGELRFEPDYPTLGNAFREWRRGADESVTLQGVGESLADPEVNKSSVQQTAVLDAAKEQAPAFTPLDQTADQEAPLLAHLRLEPCSRWPTDEIGRGRVLSYVTLESTRQNLLPGSLAMVRQTAYRQDRRRICDDALKDLSTRLKGPCPEITASRVQNVEGDRRAESWRPRDEARQEIRTARPASRRTLPPRHQAQESLRAAR
jgi:hypothetical protein